MHVTHATPRPQSPAHVARAHTLGSPTPATSLSVFARQPAQGRPYQKSLSSSKVPALSITSLLNHKHRAHANRPAQSLCCMRVQRVLHINTHTVASARTHPPPSLSLSLSHTQEHTHAVGERARSAGIERKECAYVFRVHITCPPGYSMALPLTAKVRAVSGYVWPRGHAHRMDM